MGKDIYSPIIKQDALLEFEDKFGGRKIPDTSKYEGMTKNAVLGSYHALLTDFVSTLIPELKYNLISIPVVDNRLSYYIKALREFIKQKSRTLVQSESFADVVQHKENEPKEIIQLKREIFAMDSEREPTDWEYEIIEKDALFIISDQIEIILKEYGVVENEDNILESAGRSAETKKNQSIKKYKLTDDEIKIIELLKSGILKDVIATDYYNKSPRQFDSVYLQPLRAKTDLRTNQLQSLF